MRHPPTNGIAERREHDFEGANEQQYDHAHSPGVVHRLLMAQVEFRAPLLECGQEYEKGDSEGARRIQAQGHGGDILPAGTPCQAKGHPTVNQVAEQDP